MGPVFRSYEPARDRLAAVKAFRLDVTPEQARALADELQRLVEAGLVHPSIVTPIAAGIEASTAYLAEEYVAGESLDVAIRHYAPAAVDKALPFIAQLAGAIDFARAAGVGHGTLHPRDIFITPDEARATGFGIAGALESIGVRPPVRRPYSAPERVAGEAWGAPADVFTLAAIAYELLTGRRIAGAVKGPDALAVNASDPREHPRGSDPILGSLVGPLSRALAEDPAVRYQSALAFARALEAAADGEVERNIADTSQAAPAAVPAPRAPASPRPPPRSKAVQPSLVDALDNETAHRAELAAVDEEITDSVEPGEPVPRRPPPEPEPAIARTTGPMLFDARDEVYRDDGIGMLGVAPSAERPRGSMLPLTIVLIAGLLVGFVAGYAVGTRTLTDAPASGELARAAPPVGGAPPAAEKRDGQAWSEQKVADAPQPAADSPAPRATEAPTPPTQAPPAHGTLTIRSTPGKVGVVIDGRWRGRTPLTLTDLSLGEHAVRVVERGYVAQNGRVTLTADDRQRDVSFTLPRERGRTPPTPRPPAGSLRQAEGAPRSTTGSGGPARVEGREDTAAARFAGSLYVDSRPRGARVFLDGRPVGTTPLQLGNVAVGSHVVRLELTGHRTWTSTTRVVAGQPARVTGSLEQLP